MAKDAKESVKLKSIDWLGSLPRSPTILFGVSSIGRTADFESACWWFETITPNHFEETMNKVKVSLREIMEDDNHPLMQKWASELLPKIASLVKDQNPKLYNEMIGVSLTGKTSDSDSDIRGSNP